MAYTKLSLRGISRTPSDKMTSDGGCMESLNVFLDGQETAPMPKPKDVSSQCRTRETQSTVIYIHKTAQYTHYILKSGNVILREVEQHIETILTLGENVALRQIASMGNTLIINTSDGIRYSVYKNNRYNLVPELQCPNVELSVVDYGLKYIGKKELPTHGVDDVIRTATELIDEYTGQPTSKGLNVYPRFIRYAYRLYDGSHICPSNPMLFMGSTMTQSTSTIRQDILPSINLDGSLGCDVINYGVKLGEYNLVDESGVIAGIDIFSSSTVRIAREGVAKSYSDLNGYCIFDITEEKKREELNLALEKGFYKVASIELGHNEERIIEFLKDDDLVEKEVLSVVYDSNNKIRTSNIQVYNERLVASNVEVELFSGTGIPDCTIQYNGNGHDIWMQFFMEDGTYVNSESIHLDSGRTLSTWLFYPGNCIGVNIYEGQTRRMYLEMQPCSINGSYAILNYREPLLWNATLPGGDDRDNPVVKKNNYIFQSEVQNPFVFPLLGRHSFDSNVIKTATTTRALSQGQFGQFPLYVFLEDGIYSMETSSTGVLANKVPLSRDVALSADSISPIEQAIIFSTAKGVMILAGSEIQNLSMALTGNQQEYDQGIKDLLKDDPTYSTIVTNCSDGTPFLDFISNAKTAYDYKNRRLLLFNEDKHYIYVYMLETQTWHKMALGGRKGDVVILNSYPDCYISFRGNEQTLGIVWDFSTTLTDNGATPMRGLIITRPFDLENPDVLKTIKHLKIRGKYKRFDTDNSPRVRYSLLGSQDGIHFARLTSLRGKSWKLYRMLIVLNLDNNERISWVDLDFETRFFNKLR